MLNAKKLFVISILFVVFSVIFSASVFAQELDRQQVLEKLIKSAEKGQLGIIAQTPNATFGQTVLDSGPFGAFVKITKITIQNVNGKPLLFMDGEAITYGILGFGTVGQKNELVPEKRVFKVQIYAFLKKKAGENPRLEINNELTPKLKLQFSLQPDGTISAIGTDAVRRTFILFTDLKNIVF